MNAQLTGLKDLAIGPNVRNYLEIPYDGQPKRQSPSHEQLIEIEKQLYQMIKIKPLKDSALFVDLVEEVVVMGMGRVGLNLIDFYPSYMDQTDYRLIAACAHASLLECNYKQAEHYYLQASQVEPEEPAPFVNLAQIYVETKQLEEGEKACISGLKVDANHPRLWELFGFFVQAGNSGWDKEKTSQYIKNKAQELDSWVGVSFAADFLFGSDQSGLEKKLQVYNQYYQDGNRDWNFLIEYTGMLGSQGLFEKIIAICQECQEGVPWQLELHRFQALLAMNHFSDAIKLGQEILNNPSITQTVVNQLGELIQDAKEELEKSKGNNNEPIH